MIEISDKNIDIRTLKKLVSAIILKDYDNKTKFNLLMPMAHIGATKKNINSNKTLNVERTMADYVGNMYNSVPVKLQVVMNIQTGFGGTRRNNNRRTRRI